MNSGDALTGSGTTAKLTAVLNGTAATPTMTNVVTADITDFGATAITGTNISGLKTINFKTSTDTTAITDLQTKVETVSLTNTAAGATVRVQDSALAGSADALAVTLSGVTNGVLTVRSESGAKNGYESVSIASGGSAANRVAVTDGNDIGLKTITVTGTQKLTLNRDTLTDATVRKIDASAADGGLVLGHQNRAFNPNTTTKGAVEIIGGKAADTFFVDGATAERYNITGGEGADTLALVGVTGSTTAPTLSSINNLRVTDTAGTGVAANNVSYNLLGVSGIEKLILNSAAADNTGVVTLSNLTHNTAGLTVDLMGTGAEDTQTFNGLTYSALGTTGTADAVTFSFSNKDADGNAVSVGNNAITVTPGTLSNIEKLTINGTQFTTGTSTGTELDMANTAVTTAFVKDFTFTTDGGKAAAGSSVLGTIGGAAGTVEKAVISSGSGTTVILNQAANSSVEISGAGQHTVSANVAAKGIVMNGSAATGKLVLTGNTAADSLFGGSADDTLTGGDGTDSVTGGAGADTFVFNRGDNDGANGAAVADIITDFVAGTDKLQFAGITDIVSAQQAAVQAAVTALAAGSTDAQIATAMANANTTDEGVSFAVFAGNTYVYLEKTGATTTHVEADNLFIKLAGVTTVPTFAADVIA